MTQSDAILAAETRRCECLRLQDFEGLKRLLHPDLVHVHARGNQDTMSSYLKYVQETVEILNVVRSGLVVKIFHDAAVMTGVQVNTARLRGQTPTVTTESQVMQVWVSSGGDWRLVAFQATPLGAPPPAVQR